MSASAVDWASGKSLICIYVMILVSYIYDTIRYDTKHLTCAEKPTERQLNLTHETENRKSKKKN